MEGELALAQTALEHALRRRDARGARIHLNGLAQSTSGGFECGFHHVMAVAAMVADDVQVERSGASRRSPELLSQRGIEAAEPFRRYLGTPHAEGAAAQIDGGCDQGLIHGHGSVPIAANACLVAERLPQGFAEANAYVLDGVMGID